MTISEIKQRTLETAPYFFTAKSKPDGRFKITAPMKDRFTGKVMGETKRFFNPENNELEHN